MGIQFFIGGTGQGKTTMAQHLCGERAEKRGVPVITLDPEGVLHDKGAEEVREVAPSEASVVVPVWTHGSSLVYTPRGEDSDPDCEDAITLFRMVRKGGKVNLLVDECAHYASADSPSIKGMRHLCRAHRLQGVDMYFTTQAPRDIHPRIWNLRHEVYVFNQEDSGSLNYLQQQLRLPDSWKNRIMSLPPYRFVKWEKRSNALREEETEA